MFIYVCLFIYLVAHIIALQGALNELYFLKYCSCLKSEAIGEAM